MKGVPLADHLLSLVAGDSLAFPVPGNGALLIIEGNEHDGYVVEQLLELAFTGAQRRFQILDGADVGEGQDAAIDDVFGRPVWYDAQREPVPVFRLDLPLL